VDPTGAGDTFAGGLLGYIASQDDLSFEAMKRAVIAGSAMASFTVEKFGVARLLELDEKMIQDRMEQFRSLVHYN
jgi:sugar/nucleoside kinase (ribokinase family)